MDVQEKLKHALELLNEFCEFNDADMFDLRRLPDLQDRAEDMLRNFSIAERPTIQKRRGFTAIGPIAAGSLVKLHSDSLWNATEIHYIGEESESEFMNCECGSDSANVGGHSSWCPKH